jgi:hypothetical protein
LAPLNGMAYEGCSSFEARPDAQGTNRYGVLSSNTMNLTPAANSRRTLTFYIGRKTSAPTTVNGSVRIDVVPFLTFTKIVGRPCSGATCTLEGSNGSVWQKVEIPNIFWPWTQASIRLQVVWSDGAVTEGVDDVLVDGFSFV